MPVYKLIKNGEVVNTIIADTNFFISPSDMWDSYEEVVPTPSPEPVPPSQDITVSPIEFKLLFTSTERIAIRSASATDPVIEDFFDIVDDPRLTHVNLSLQSTNMAINYLETAGLIGEGRAAEILSAKFQ